MNLPFVRGGGGAWSYAPGRAAGGGDTPPRPPSPARPGAAGSLRSPPAAAGGVTGPQLAGSLLGQEAGA